MDDPELKARLETNAYAYAHEFAWPKTGQRFVKELEDLVASVPALPRAAPLPGGAMSVPASGSLKLADTAFSSSPEHAALTIFDVAPFGVTSMS